jgi:hypothetical protein
MVMNVFEPGKPRIHWHWVDQGEGVVKMPCSIPGDICMLHIAEPQEIGVWISEGFEPIVSWLQDYRRGNERKIVPVNRPGGPVSYTREGKLFEEINDKVEDFQEKAKRIVREYILDDQQTGMTITESFSVYIVWFAKTLQNWKALIATSIPDDLYYEITYNGDKHETYVDMYGKLSNDCIPD